jgi:hypothetical protein
VSRQIHGNDPEFIRKVACKTVPAVFIGTETMNQQDNFTGTPLKIRYL